MSLTHLQICFFSSYPYLIQSPLSPLIPRTHQTLRAPSSPSSSAASPTPSSSCWFCLGTVSDLCPPLPLSPLMVFCVKPGFSLSPGELADRRAFFPFLSFRNIQGSFLFLWSALSYLSGMSSRIYILPGSVVTAFNKEQAKIGCL